MINVVNTPACIFDWIFFIVAGNKDNHKVLDEFQIWPDQTMDCRVSCPWAFEKIPVVNFDGILLFL